MKRIIPILLSIMAFVAYGCSDNEEVYKEIPQEITSFISQYYPNGAVESFATSDNQYRVVLKDGPTLVFNKACLWQMVNGNGSVIVQNFLFNELPPELYAYLQETENLGQVFSVSRTSTDYTVVLLQYTINYNVETGKITGDEASIAK